MFSIEWYFPWSYLDWVLKAQLLFWIISVVAGFWIMRLGLQGRWLRGPIPASVAKNRSDETTPRLPDDPTL